MDFKKFLPFVLFAFFAFIISGLIYINYPLPSHSDSWMHLKFAKEILEKGAFEFKFSAMEYPSAYHLILAFFMLLGISPVIIGIAFPTIVTFMVSVSAYLLVRKFFNETAALLAGVAVLLMKSSIMLLGYWFLVPVALSFALLLAAIYFFLEAFNENGKRSFLLFVSVLAALALIYPYAALIFLPVSFIYSLVNFRKLVSSRLIQAFYAACALLFLALVFFLPALAGALAAGFSQGNFVFTVDIIGFISVPLVILAIIGVLALKEKKETTFFIIAIAFLLAIKQYAELTGVSYLLDYRRLPLFIALFALILAALGLEKIYAFLIKQNLPHIKEISRAAIVLFLAFSIATMPFAYLDSLQKDIGLGELPAMQWIKENTPENSVILADSFLGNPIYVLTGRKAWISEPQVYGNEQVTALKEFLGGNCSTGEGFREVADFVYANKRLECSYLEEKFVGDANNFVYLIKK